jgi:hypothetical protein
MCNQPVQTRALLFRPAREAEGSQAGPGKSGPKPPGGMGIG